MSRFFKGLEAEESIDVTVIPGCSNSPLEQWKIDDCLEEFAGLGLPAKANVKFKNPSFAALVDANGAVEAGLLAFRVRESHSGAASPVSVASLPILRGRSTQTYGTVDSGGLTGGERGSSKKSVTPLKASLIGISIFGSASAMSGGALLGVGLYATLTAVTLATGVGLILAAVGIVALLVVALVVLSRRCAQKKREFKSMTLN